ncbi:type 1 fimbrial protein [Escherichia coli]|uniref:fimbrial protein n=2 Tax=Escherichia coli TaxID=562 RepID=UPI001772E201|nr:fimbrial protein [Escherichia coli]EFN4940715.1 type 1 fimbrial protein [Escherichia coli]EID9913951.1 type 1 fimbrial protein [Escherichia coli]MCG2988207.1 type 1 fimbrial protein [Escherichia coli]MCN4458011.1 type 1 fimbrial protein [Escherichia coli]MEB7215898.1 type 1 fimbrial protein [Escherichia coli]
MPGKQMLCCILISIISEGDMKIFISLFLFIISTNSFADDITHAGVVRIEGLITEKTCIISDESKNFTVNMPDVPSSSVRSAGDVTEKVYFSITLTRCGSDVGNAYIKFTGNTVSEDASLYKLEDGSVEGLALTIFDKNKGSISNDVKSMVFSLTSSVDNILHFFAAYKALKNNVQPRDANASVSFIVTYD